MTTTTITTSAPPLQALSEAAASGWLLQWAGVVGFVAVRASGSHSQGRCGAQRDVTRDTPTRPSPHTSRSASRTHDSCNNAVPGQRAAKEGRAKPRGGGRVGGVTLRCEETVPWGAAATQLQPAGPKGRITQEESPTQSQWSRAQVPAWCVPAALDSATVRLNVERCASYLRSHLPPLLLEAVLDTAWRAVSEEVTLGGREASVPDHQVGEWARRAPVLLGLSDCLSGARYPLDLTGLPHEALRDALAYVERYFAVERLSALALTKRKASRGGAGSLVEGAVLGRLLHRASLVSLSLNLNLVEGSVLKEVSRLSLQELDVCGGRHSEEQVLQELCGLPFSAADQVVEALRGGRLETLPVTPLRKSLRRLNVSLPGLPAALYQTLLAVFPGLHHYTPSCGAAACVRGYARMAGPSGAATPLCLLSLNLGRASTHDVLEAARVCPALRDVSLSIELDSEDTLRSLQACGRLSGVQLSYFPSSVSAPPKVEGRLLLPLLNALGPQLLSLGLTGFSVRGGVMAALAGLPELRRLSLTDCWLAHPDAAPCHAFPGLESLLLNFLPPLDTLRLLTAGSCLQAVDVSVVASEARGSGLTDGSVQQLVSSGALTSILSFCSSSPFLTLASLRHLAALPHLRSVGSLARWGLTREELGCVGHSGPAHLLCRP
ncbi:uncharacterized protein LOC123502880 [Portunus trituberculatus]|uniref:uncharacterized protein LOC123502880 n=1 Tax=Portunus trituberculatus TaxID=210409 RepID=UPI001E1CF06A|nr:uncharacterized protein LOC123502880 [Portunus trituberculatus]XP_045108102.1 uncharacterized protein LOC123502880 [Portunus trituberculatus]XP_045108103.1 uncharacterized protein LOC123502880 [Portunus trituberculatus]XP_045108104.1 uncharacterized protein LOC123502880 [Portunus trituberculatus]XP_045108105.1 uncharacterized protein LOC123502880 [Portunus trituberculatus]